VPNIDNNGPSVATTLREALSDAVRSDSAANFYDEHQDEILGVARQALAEPSPANIAAWVHLFARVSSLAVEGPAEATLKLREDHREEFEAALTELDDSDRAAISAFVNALNSEPEAPDGGIQEFTAAIAPQRPVLASFRATETADGKRVPLHQGTLTISDRHGAQLMSITARTGGFVASYKHVGGPTPPGLYIVSNYQPDRHGTPGMTLNGVSFSFNLDPAAATDVYDRSALRIHPDQDGDGTHGCVGLEGDAGELRHAAEVLSSLLEGGRYLLSVSYS
jgi:hypothetical protein